MCTMDESIYIIFYPLIKLLIGWNAYFVFNQNKNFKAWSLVNLIIALPAMFTWLYMRLDIPYFGNVVSFIIFDLPTIEFCFSIFWNLYGVWLLQYFHDKDKYNRNFAAITILLNAANMALFVRVSGYAVPMFIESLLGNIA